jgi:hypothetical protein
MLTCLGGEVAAEEVQGSKALVLSAVAGSKPADDAAKAGRLARAASPAQSDSPNWAEGSTAVLNHDHVDLTADGFLTGELLSEGDGHLWFPFF